LIPSDDRPGGRRDAALAERNRRAVRGVAPGIAWQSAGQLPFREEIDQLFAAMDAGRDRLALTP
jgi:hypothetical protein